MLSEFMTQHLIRDGETRKHDDGEKTNYKKD